MQGLENCKGQWCFIKPIICQKGFCSECNIYLNIFHVFTSSLEEKANHVKVALDQILSAELHQHVSSREYKRI